MVKCRICGASFESICCPYCGSLGVIDKPPEEKEDPETKVIPEDFKDNYGFPLQCLVAIYQLKQDLRLLGAGFLTDLGYVVTSAHALDIKDMNCGKILLGYPYSAFENKTEVSLCYYQKENDIVILKPMGSLPKEIPVLRFSQRKIHEGDEIFTLDATEDFATPIKGTVVNPAKKRADTSSGYPFIKTTLPLFGQASGYPVWDLAGELIGMTSVLKKEKDKKEYAFLVSTKAISDALERLKNNRI